MDKRTLSSARWQVIVQLLVEPELGLAHRPIVTARHSRIMGATCRIDALWWHPWQQCNYTGIPFAQVGRLCGAPSARTDGGKPRPYGVYGDSHSVHQSGWSASERVRRATCEVLCRGGVYALPPRPSGTRHLRKGDTRDATMRNVAPMFKRVGSTCLKRSTRRIRSPEFAGGFRIAASISRRSTAFWGATCCGCWRLSTEAIG